MVNSIYDIIKTINKSDRQYIKSDVKFLDEKLRESQFLIKDIIKIIDESKFKSILFELEQEIYLEKINLGFKAHGQRHIVDVVLFSFLIGGNYLNYNDLYLLLISAKYHDIGRTEEGNIEHAKASAEIAFQQLNPFLSKGDLSIIITAIEFHEVSRYLENADIVFQEIATKNGVMAKEIKRARIISEILKDADALDRTRFVNRARLNSKYLLFNFSKRFIKFSAELQEKYACDDLIKYEFDNKLLKYYTPQEVLRMLRRSENSINLSFNNRKK